MHRISGGGAWGNRRQYPTLNFLGFLAPKTDFFSENFLRKHIDMKGLDWAEYWE